MDLHLNRLRWEQRVPDWPAAAVAGFAAGAVLMVLELVWSALVTTDGPWRISHQVAGILMGHEALQSNDFSVGVVAMALATHYALGIGFGLVLGWIIAGFHWEASVSIMFVVGALFGLALYLINFHGMVLLFPWFASLRGWATLCAHLVFGMVAAVMYWKLNRQGAD